MTTDGRAVECGPLRVLHIEYGLGFGGSAISLAELVRGLKEATRVESTILTFQAPGLNEHSYPGTEVLRWRLWLNYQTRADLADRLARWRIPGPLRTVVWKAYGLAAYLFEWHLTRAITRLVRSRGIDVVHANNGWELSAVRAAHRGGARCVIHFRGYQGGEPGTIRERFGAELDRTVVGYIAISASVAEAIRKLGAPPEKIRTIHNPVTVEPYQAAAARRAAIRATHGFGPDDLVAGVFGRITSWKGQVEFLEAMRPMMHECPALRILFVGDQSDATDVSYHARLVALAAAPDLAGRVVLAGFQHDAPGYFNACDIVVHCSRTPEPFGRVIIEGMAAGRAVIAMDEGGPQQIITTGADGILVPPRDGPRLAAEVVALAKDPARRAALGRAAAQTVPARFSPPAIAREVLDVYEREQ